MRRLLASKRGISDEYLNVVMLVVVALAVISITLCIFVIGRSVSPDTPDTPEESDTVPKTPASESTDPSVESPSDSTLSTDEPSSDTVAVTETDPTPDTESTPETEKTTEPPTESESDCQTEPEPPTPPMPESFVPITPGNVSTISGGALYSDCAILVDCSTNKVIAQRLPDYNIFPASMTKIMTVIVACEQIKDLEARLTVPYAIITHCYNEGASVAGFTAGQSVTARDMLYGAILPSGADATFALAMLVTGKTDIFEAEAEFAKLMNQKAKELGMTKTNFVNASGLHHGEHVSSVRDIATMMNYAMHIPLVKQLLSTIRYTTSYGKALTSAVFNYKTDNKHPTYSNGATMIAAKSGYTDYAMFCLASYHVDTNGKGYVIVTASAKSNSLQPITDAKYISEKYIK